MTWGGGYHRALLYQQHFASDGGAAAMVALLFSLNRAGVTRLLPYLLTGVLWFFMLQSGVHATVAGILLAFFIPLRTRNAADEVPLDRLEHAINPGSRL
jgi:NhaA family Na+:H+ antiporter